MNSTATSRTPPRRRADVDAPLSPSSTAPFPASSPSSPTRRIAAAEFVAGCAARRPPGIALVRSSRRRGARPSPDADRGRHDDCLPRRFRRQHARRRNLTPPAPPPSFCVTATSRLPAVGRPLPRGGAPRIDQYPRSTAPTRAAGARSVAISNGSSPRPGRRTDGGRCRRRCAPTPTPPATRKAAALLRVRQRRHDLLGYEVESPDGQPTTRSAVRIPGEHDRPGGALGAMRYFEAGGEFPCSPGRAPGLGPPRVPLGPRRRSRQERRQGTGIGVPCGPVDQRGLSAPSRKCLAPPPAPAARARVRLRSVRP